MAEVKTAPVSKPVSKAAAKTSKPKPSVQAKRELTGSVDRLIQPFLNNSLPANATLGAQGNRTSISGLWKNSVQTKLKVGQPGDKYEQEADAVADKVISSPKPDISKQPIEDKLNQKPALQLSTEPEEEVQASLEEEPEIQKQADEEPEIQAMPAEEDEVQASTEPDAIQTMGGDNAVSPDFESKLSTAKSGGSPLPQSTISQVEPHVNADLSGVRVHTDSNAAELNQSLGAQAFANQNHIFFNEGKYKPGTTEGDHLIAHEATHTVQQGASLKKKPVEDEVPDELQMAADEPVNEAKKAAAAPPPSAPPADANANTGAGDSGNSTGSNGSADSAKAPADNSNAIQENSVPAPPANSGSPDTQVMQPQEDLQRENPITQRAANYKEEEVAQVQALAMEGNSEQAMDSFTGAGASQVAMAFPTMGDTLNQKLGAEKQAAATEAPKLTAGTTGVKDQKSKKATDPGNGKSADLKDGITEAEPGPQQLEPHQEGAPLPSHREDKRLDEGKPAKEESGGFFSWLFDKFKNLMGGITVIDKGLITQAGAAPKLDTKGKANPQRAENQSKEGKDQVNKEKQEAANEINNNPGQQNVQPLFFEEPKEVIIDATLQSTATTTEDQAMADFAHLPLPESVRTQTDLDLAPRMEKTLAKPRQETKAAAQKRDTEKQAAINDKQAEVEKMNKDAEKEQQNLVNENRQAIAAEQKRGVDEAETQMNAFSTEADKEKARANKDVNDRIKNDQAEGEKKLKAAEGEAAAKKKEGEDQAKAEKEAAKKNSKDKSWWGKFKDAVSSAVSWVTEKIGKIFDAIRKAVKFIIDTAKKAALALIEAGRKWIIDKLDKFGSWLKEKANKYLKHFPALRKRVNAFIDKTVDGAKKLVNKVADGLKKGVEALADALGKAINSVLSAFEGVLTAAVQFAGAMLKGDFAEALKIAFMATCKVAGIDPNPILNFINKAGETIGLIFKNPAAFFGNVAGGVKLGINQFTKNIKKHLISGLISWLTGAMSDVPIQMPAKFDLKGIFSLVMQILGLTYQRIRAKVVKRIGPKGEQVVSGMEKTFQFVKDLVTKGPIVIWERIKDKFNEIKEMAMEKIRNLVTIEVVKAGIKWIIGLLNPASAIVKAVIMLYDFVMFLIERKDQIIGFVTAVFDTVGPLARGQIKKAGNAVEGAMGRGIPVILGLLANLAGLGGIGKSVSKVIKTIQKPVDKVVDPVIGWLVKQGKKLSKKVKGALSGGSKGVAIGAMKKAGAVLQKVPQTADKAEQKAQADLSKELKVANKGLPKKAGKVTGNITNKGKIIESSKAEFKLSAGGTTKIFVRKYATQSEEAKHVQIIKDALAIINKTDKPKGKTGLLTTKKALIKEQEKAVNGKLKKGVKLTIELSNPKTYQQDGHFKWKGVIAPNATEISINDDASLDFLQTYYINENPGQINNEIPITGQPGRGTSVSDGNMDFAYVTNIMTIPKDLNAVVKLYERDAFDGNEAEKSRMLKSSLVLVFGVNKYDDLKPSGQGSKQDVQNAINDLAVPASGFKVKALGMMWDPLWKLTTAGAEASGNASDKSTQPKNIVQQAYNQSTNKTDIDSYISANAKKQRMVPYGRIRDKIRKDNYTTSAVNGLSAWAKNVYLHSADNDAVSLKLRPDGVDYSQLDEQARSAANGLYSRYNEILGAIDEDKLPILASGGYEYRLQTEGGHLAENQVLDYLASKLDNEVRVAISKINSRVLYFPESNTLFLAKKGSQDGPGMSKANLFGAGKLEGRSLVNNLLKTKGKKHVKFDLDARIVDKRERVDISNKAQFQFTMHQANLADAIKVEHLFAMVTQEQSNADRTDFKRNIKSSYNWKKWGKNEEGKPEKSVSSILTEIYNNNTPIYYTNKKMGLADFYALLESFQAKTLDASLSQQLLLHLQTSAKTRDKNLITDASDLHHEIVPDGNVAARLERDQIIALGATVGETINNFMKNLITSIIGNNS
ncbi:MAG: hypothetical protein Roseis2KO_44330 [Roseivirga sp.]